MRQLAVVAAFAVLLGIASAARADETSCGGELSGAVATGNLIVAPGADCTLRDVAVRGDVVVGAGAVLRVLGGVAIIGSLRADHCALVHLEPSLPAAWIAVAGNVDIQRCTETSGKLFTAGRVVIGGNFACHDNEAPCFAVSLTIGGDAEIRRNRGLSYIESSTIGGSLRCLGNAGVTDYGLPNTVGQEKLGQCAGLS